jgi:hypothetical protein
VVGVVLLTRSIFSVLRTQSLICSSKMRSFAVAFALLAGVNAFQTNPLSSARASLVTVNQYIPDGFTADSYKKFKEEEKKKLAKQNLGGVGPRGFKSRSMQSFQEAMERGEASHLLPVFNAKEKLKSGELKKEDIPVSFF